MGKYLVSRIIRSLISVIIVVGIVMVMIYSMLDRNLVFASDNAYRNLGNNQQEIYKYSKWEEYGYIDYVTFADYLNMLYNMGRVDEETRAAAVQIGKKASKDSELTASYVAKFTKYYEAQGYKVVRLKAVMSTSKKYATGGQQQLFAYRDLPLTNRLWTYLKNLVTVDNTHNVENYDGERGISFTLYDPVYGGEKFSPALIGSGTTHRYLLYFDSQFPYIHQNLITINLGQSYTVNQGVDVFTTMNNRQGSYQMSEVTYPSGLTEQSADNLHSATFVAGSREATVVNQDRFVDDYTNVQTIKSGLSKVGYSFVIGIIAIALAYLLGVPLGIWMSRKKDKLVDKIGTVYIVFILAVPSLAYIFLFKAVGGKLGLPTTFDMESASKLMYVLPIVSLALPSVASLMKWLRRYMIDQMNSDYVKFARSGGLSENEIFTKHILKNASIPLIHSIPADILGALVGAIITERVYVVPGAGNLLTKAINMYDNGVIVGVTLFYAILSVTAIILGDVLMSIVDPRISFTSKSR